MLRHGDALLARVPHGGARGLGQAADADAVDRHRIARRAHEGVRCPRGGARLDLERGKDRLARLAQEAAASTGTVPASNVGPPIARARRNAHREGVGSGIGTATPTRGGPAGTAPARPAILAERGSQPPASGIAGRPRRGPVKLSQPGRLSAPSFSFVFRDRRFPPVPDKL